MSYKLRFPVLGFMDACIITSSVLLVYVLRFDFTIQETYIGGLLFVISAHIVLNLVFYYVFNIYHRVWQYASIGEALAILKATLVAEVGFILLHHTIIPLFPNMVIPRSYYLSCIFIVVGVGGSRFAWRIFRDAYLQNTKEEEGRNVMIIGAGQAGVLLAKELKRSQFPHLNPVVFIDDDPHKKGLEVLGIPVVGGREEIANSVARFDIRDIVIAVPSAPREELAKLIDMCKGTKANLKILPRVSDLINGRVSVQMLREVVVEDLLGREPVKVDLRGITDYVKDQIVLVTGAGGSIGSELCRQVARFAPRRLLLLGHGENSIYDIELELREAFPNLPIEPIIADIQDRRRMEEVFACHIPHIVFHAAAHKHVPLMEKNPAEAIKNNVLGTKNVAECSHQYGVQRFVMISSDKAVNPTSIMGASKRLAEMIIQGMDRVSHTRFAAVRFGNVLGSRGSVIPLFKRQIQRGEAVTVTHPEMIRYFMTIPEAAHLVIQAGALAEGGETFILDMGEPVKIVDLARDMIRLSGLVPERDIPIVYTGMRPGEKLFEELLTDEEGLSVTKHDRIFVGKPGDFSWNELQLLIQKLERVVTQEDEGPVNPYDIKNLIRTIVPTYQGIDEEDQVVELEPGLNAWGSARRVEA